MTYSNKKVLVPGMEGGGAGGPGKKFSRLKSSSSSSATTASMIPVTGSGRGGEFLSFGSVG